MLHKPQETINLNSAWKFCKGQAPNAAQPTFDDSAWSSIDLPHTWNAQDGQDGGNNYDRGPAWYRRGLKLGSRWKGHRVFLRFAAANTVTDVFLNGEPVGQHRGGFAAFCFEVTRQVRFDGESLLAVRVDNSHFDDVPPWSADFTFFGGLYRNVELLIRNPICITPMDYASPGVYLQQKRVSPERADLEVLTKISNGTGSAAAVRVVTTVQDAAGKRVARVQALVEIAKHGAADVTQPIRLDDPHLWNGRADPYLYTVTVQLVRDGDIVDEVRQPLGLRFFHVDPDKGFFLNGRPLDLHGVNRHQDRLDRGWAIGRPEHDEDLALIRELGCTGVRLAHYQHDDYVYSICDRTGLIVWAEIPLVDRIDNTDAFRANCRQQLIELIRQNYNHPSILFWGVHNEVTAPWRKGPDAAGLVRELAKLAKEEDPTRLSVCAATEPVDHPANWQTDLVAINRYFGWYRKSPDEFGAWADVVHHAHLEKAMGISEYGAGASIHHHEFPPEKPSHDGPWHPEEWQALVHERHWRQIRERPYLWCKFVWNMFDFASDGRGEGDTAGRNDKGLVTYDRKTKKDAFYWYKANWSEEPFVYLTSRRFTPRSERVATVKVYSNCDRVDLFVNGASVGEKPGTDHIFLWPDVRLSSGQNVIQAVGQRGTRMYTDRVEWTVEAEH